MWRHKLLTFKRQLEAYQLTIFGYQFSGLHLFWWILILIAIVFLEKEVVLQIISLLIAVILHELAHGWVAFRLGDPTAKMQGRLSLNPAVHLDIVGSLLLPGILLASGAGVLFGWAKPVPVNTRYFENQSKGMMLVAIAGPLSNIAIAWVSAWILISTPFFPTWLQLYLIPFLTGNILINGVLAIFNSIPIPPLDGSRILAYFLPRNARQWLYYIEPYGIFILFLLLYLGFFDFIIRVMLPYFVKWVVPAFI